MLFLTPMEITFYLIIALFVSIITWLILQHFRKKKLKPLHFLMIFLIVFIGVIIFDGLYWPLWLIFNWAMPWHYNYYSPFQIFAVQFAVLFIYYFILFVLLFDTGSRNAIIVSIICTLMIPLFSALCYSFVFPIIAPLFP
ncbi:MAG: hypothetical protein ACFFDP_09890 [Promethearchaeota archaeon]